MYVKKKISKGSNYVNNPFSSSQMAKLEKNVHVTEYLNQNIKTLSDLKDVHKNIKETVESLGQQVINALSHRNSYEDEQFHFTLSLNC